MEIHSPFLQIVAKDLLSKFGTDLSKTTVVFPNNRAKLFFNEYLANEAKKPIWSPQYTSIKQLFQQQTKLTVADSLCLISELYKTYINHLPAREDFDKFFSWGEIMLSDFDDVDKNLVDAEKIFRNIAEQGEYIDTYEHLTDTQKKALETFFSNFSVENRTLLKTEFINLWNSLIAVYKEYKSALAQKKIAYEGMLYRSVIEEIDKCTFVSEKYVFIGFNVLNECEKKLFKHLRKSGKAIFYWDYDKFYTNNINHEAGTFMRENISMFPPENKGFDFLSTDSDKKITFISAPTETAQAKFLSDYISSLDGMGEKESDTAVVLCNENLLLTSLHSIPDCVKTINITMGFPLKQTPAYSLLQALLKMQGQQMEAKSKKFKYNDIEPVLKHTYIRLVFSEIDKLHKKLKANHRFYPDLSELWEAETAEEKEKQKTLFKPVETVEELCLWTLDVIRIIASFHKTDDIKTGQSATDEVLYDDLYKEALFRTYTQINRILSLQQTDGIEISLPLFNKLVIKILSALSVPFSGEMARGLQIMGFLETRNLDFKNVILLSVNEGQLPSSGKDQSFIPHNLRLGYGMTTIEHKNSLYAYYFYRLLQRAENITLVYSTSDDGTGKGQMSRFMLQLLAETKFNICTKNINSSIKFIAPEKTSIPKTDEIVKKLEEKYCSCNSKDSFLSASALKTYLTCPLRFYFKYVLGLKETDELTDDVDSAKFGTIFHSSAEEFYRRIGGIAETDDKGEYTINEFKSFVVNLSDFELFNKESKEDNEKAKKYLEEIVDNKFKKEFFNLPKNAPMPKYTGIQLIKRNVIIEYLIRLFKNIDRKHAPFTILGLEKKVCEEIELSSIGIKVKVGGIIDRLDMKDGVVRVLDYKTGGSSDENAVKKIENLFDGTSNNAFQAILYSVIIKKNLETENKDYSVEPALLHTRNSDPEQIKVTVGKTKGNDGSLSIDNIKDEFRDTLNSTLTKIFDKNTPFDENPGEGYTNCTYCEFKDICMKKI